MAGSDHLNFTAQAKPEQRIVYKSHGFPERHAYKIGKFNRRGPGTTFPAIYRNKIRINAGSDNGFANA